MVVPVSFFLVPDNHHSEAVRELLKLDVHYRRKSGSPPPIDEYRQRFPSLASVWFREVLEPVAGSPASPVKGESA